MCFEHKGPKDVASSLRIGVVFELLPRLLRLRRPFVASVGEAKRSARVDDCDVCLYRLMYSRVEDDVRLQSLFRVFVVKARVLLDGDSVKPSEGHETIMDHVVSRELLLAMHGVLHREWGVPAAAAEFGEVRQALPCGVGHREPRLLVSEHELLREGVGSPEQGCGFVSSALELATASGKSAFLISLRLLTRNVAARSACSLSERLLKSVLKKCATNALLSVSPFFCGQSSFGSMYLRKHSDNSNCNHPSPSTQP